METNSVSAIVPSNLKGSQQSWSAVVVEWLSTELPGCRPEFAPQAALAIRLTKLVAPPNGYSMSRLYWFLKPSLERATGEVKHDRG